AERQPPQRLLDAEPTQYLHRVWHHLDAGPDARKAPCLLIDRDVVAGLSKRRSGSKSANAGPDHGDGKHLLYHAGFSSRTISPKTRRSYFRSIPAFSATSFHFLMSATSRAISSAGEPGRARTPTCSNLDLTSGMVKTSRNARLMVLLTPPARPF